jgi:hypothetical protein
LHGKNGNERDPLRKGDTGCKLIPAFCQCCQQAQRETWKITCQTPEQFLDTSLDTGNLIVYEIPVGRYRYAQTQIRCIKLRHRPAPSGCLSRPAAAIVDNRVRIDFFPAALGTGFQQIVRDALIEAFGNQNFEKHHGDSPVSIFLKVPSLNTEKAGFSVASLA